MNAAGFTTGRIVNEIREAHLQSSWNAFAYPVVDQLGVGVRHLSMRDQRRMVEGLQQSHVVGGDGEGALALDPSNIGALTRTCQKWWPYFYIFSVAYIAYVVPVQARWIKS